MQKILKTEAILLSLILLLAFILRIYKITEVPTGFYTDEAAIGYNAYKLLKTGKDEHNVSWPIFFQSLGDYRTPIAIYSNIPVIYLIGLSEFSVRLTTVLYGIGTVLLFYFTGKKLMNKKMGLLSAFILAISPWHIHLSRWGAEYAGFPFFTVLGLLFFLWADRKPFLLLFSFLIFGVGLYTYYPAWIVIPLLIIGVTVYWLFKKRKKGLPYLAGGIVIFAVFSIPLLLGIQKGYALTRWKSINFQKLSINQRIDKFKQYYADHFGKDFLFTKGDIGYPGHFITRQSVKGMGELYWFESILILIGIYFCILCILRKKKEWLIVLFMLILYPLGTALTMEGPFATRSVIGIIPLVLFSALGINILTNIIRNWKIRYFIILIMLIPIGLSFSQYLLRYYHEYPRYSSDFWGWQFGPRDIISYFKKNYEDYDELVMTGDFNGAYIFVPFYTLDKYPKIKAGWMKDHYNSSKKQLFAVRPHEIEQQGYKGKFITKDYLYYPDKSVAMVFGEIKKKEN